jgi:plasmid stability protein
MPPGVDEKPPDPVARVASIDYFEGIDRTRRGMASITIRNIEESVKARLRVRAAHHGRSMEDEVRHILRHALEEELSQPNLADLASALFGEHGVELEPHPPVAVRKAPDFGS